MPPVDMAQDQLDLPLDTPVADTQPESTPEPDTPEPKTLREELAAAFEADGKPSSKPEAKGAKDGVQEEGQGQEGKVAKPETQPEVQPKGKSPAKPETQQTDTGTPEARQGRAPGSWKPAIRERWGELPAPVQQEILRREAEVSRGLNESAAARKFAEDFGKVTAPYQSVIAAEGGDAMKFVNNLMATAAGLYHGAPRNKVDIVAGLIKNFNIDIATLDQVLAGQMPQGQASPQTQLPDAAAFIRQEIQQALSPILRGQQIAEQQNSRKVQQDVESFASDPANEFFEDVRDTMADLLEFTARRGEEMDLQTAYKRAIMMHSDIAELVADRELRKKAAQASSAAVAAKSKATSIAGAPNKSGAGGRPQTLRGDIESAFAQYENQ